MERLNGDEIYDEIEVFDMVRKGELKDTHIVSGVLLMGRFVPLIF